MRKEDGTHNFHLVWVFATGGGPMLCLEGVAFNALQLLLC